MKELVSLTGYVRGGCSPVGMKKAYPAFIDVSAKNHERIYVSAGMRGVQLILSPEDLAGFIKAKFCDLVQ